MIPTNELESFCCFVYCTFTNQKFRRHPDLSSCHAHAVFFLIFFHFLAVNHCVWCKELCIIYRIVKSASMTSPKLKRSYFDDSTKSTWRTFRSYFVWCWRNWHNTLTEPVISKTRSFHSTWFWDDWKEFSYFTQNPLRNLKFEMWVCYSTLHNLYEGIQLWTSLTLNSPRKRGNESPVISKEMGWKYICIKLM